MQAYTELMLLVHCFFHFWCHRNIKIYCRAIWSGFTLFAKSQYLGIYGIVCRHKISNLLQITTKCCETAKMLFLTFINNNSIVGAIKWDLYQLSFHSAFIDLLCILNSSIEPNLTLCPECLRLYIFHCWMRWGEWGGMARGGERWGALKLFIIAYE